MSFQEIEKKEESDKEKEIENEIESDKEKQNENENENENEITDKKQDLEDLEDSNAFKIKIDKSTTPVLFNPNFYYRLMIEDSFLQIFDSEKLFTQFEIKPDSLVFQNSQNQIGCIIYLQDSIFFTCFFASQNEKEKFVLLFQQTLKSLIDSEEVLEDEKPENFEEPIAKFEVGIKTPFGLPRTKGELIITKERIIIQTKKKKNYEFIHLETTTISKNKKLENDCNITQKEKTAFISFDSEENRTLFIEKMLEISTKISELKKQSSVKKLAEQENANLKDLRFGKNIYQYDCYIVSKEKQDAKIVLKEKQTIIIDSKFHKYKLSDTIKITEKYTELPIIHLGNYPDFIILQFFSIQALQDFIKNFEIFHKNDLDSNDLQHEKKHEMINNENQDPNEILEKKESNQFQVILLFKNSDIISGKLEIDEEKIIFNWNKKQKLFSIEKVKISTNEKEIFGTKLFFQEGDDDSDSLFVNFGSKEKKEEFLEFYKQIKKKN
ncbi:neurofilament triplet m protein-like protein [Anaeramoeba ignava]|uniref:Neurofilament triplet m protein-like protein n=1 Tax=Anaeramoeba ignava TaxID=1746090 RepID=A0A9Q0LBK2_ANAIG|nr:neurofilament triplet m protein-like protein [Anaeramoeba ignava]